MRTQLFALNIRSLCKICASQNPKEGQQCLMLAIKPKKTVGDDGKPLPLPEALERTFLAINSPAVKLQPGSLVRISWVVSIPKAIQASVDGAWSATAPAANRWPCG